MEKRINKSQITTVKVYEEKLMDGYKFFSEKTFYIPFTKIVFSHYEAKWARNESNFFFLSVDDLDDYIVRGDLLYEKPHVTIEMSSGWRDRVVKYFTTLDKCVAWCDSNLVGVNLISVS